MKTLLKKFMKDEQGLELIEYALLLFLFIIGISITAGAVADRIGVIWTDTEAELGGGAG